MMLNCLWQSQSFEVGLVSKIWSACRAHAADAGLALHTIDIFAGFWGLSEGFQQAGAAVCDLAIEYEHPAVCLQGSCSR